ncbi:MAG: cupin domain-containing protein [Chloroflexi bacterium]|nr:cupin domain-containing protein [Chloroflexota bacterium]
MPILDRNESDLSERFPGIQRWQVVNDEKGGAESLNVGDLILTPESVVPNHKHPTEEAMMVLEGELEAVLGDTVTTVHAGQTVLAPAMVRHGFVNRSGAPARLLAIFPTTKIVIIPVD